MALIDEQLAKIAEKNYEHLAEAATERAYVLPFLRALGYDTDSLDDVYPQYTADFADCNGKKVDYAVLNANSEPVIVIECKALKTDLRSTPAYRAQLSGYFQNTQSAKIGILTNGLEYLFYTDTEKPNIMDTQPYFECDLRALTPAATDEIERYKKGFDAESVKDRAKELCVKTAIAKKLRTLFETPTRDFVKMICSTVIKGNMTEARLEQCKGYVRDALSQLVRDKVNTLIKEIEKRNDIPPTQIVDPVAEPQIPCNLTAEEQAGFDSVKRIIEDRVSPRKVTITNTKHYCGIKVEGQHKYLVALRYKNKAADLKYVDLFFAERKKRKKVATTGDLSFLTKDLLEILDERQDPASTV